jgi:LacI family transcriptional regulator
MVTVRDIASKACVSTATVSRVLNDMPNVSVPTRQIVIEAAKELGYPLDRFAISGHISKSVLLLVRENALIDNSHLWDTAGEFERCTMMGVKSVFDNKGISTRLQRIEDFSSSELAGILANDISIAGVLILGGVLNREFINELTSAGVKLAVVGAEVKGMNVSSIKADYLGGMYKAVNHLASSGRKRIGLINGPQTTTSSLEKEDGYRLGLARNGLDFSPSLIFQGSFGFESGYQETIAMLDKVSDIDAIA